MTLEVIGAGFGRTGTKSPKLALEELGLGPCCRMIDILADQGTPVPQWNDVVASKPDYEIIFAGYASAVYWPVAAVWPKLLADNPDAKLILSSRSAEEFFEHIRAGASG